MNCKVVFPQLGLKKYTFENSQANKQEHSFVWVCVLILNCNQVYLIYCLIPFASHENNSLRILFLICQVVDTPYLVNPEWKNFIPGYMYNDSDLELTAESLYRQSKLIFMYLGDSVMSATFQKQCFGDDYSPHGLLHTVLSAFHIKVWLQN